MGGWWGLTTNDVPGEELLSLELSLFDRAGSSEVATNLGILITDVG